MKSSLLENVRHFLERRRTERPGCRTAITLRLAGYIHQKRNARIPLASREPGVERELLLYKQADQDSRGQARRQARNIDEAMELVAGDVAQGNEEIVAEHARLLLVAQRADGIGAGHAQGVDEDGRRRND